MKQFLFFLFFLSIVFGSAAQKGYSAFQPSVHYAFPVDNLSDITNGGVGVSLKGLVGWGSAKLQSTLTVGYTNFKVKESLTGAADFHYTTIPIMTGIRYVLGDRSDPGGAYAELQAGIVFNRLEGQGVAEDDLKETDFVWAGGIGYEYRRFDLSVRYQTSELKDSNEEISFVGIHLAYTFDLWSKNRR